MSGRATPSNTSPPRRAFSTPKCSIRPTRRRIDPVLSGHYAVEAGVSSEASASILSGGITVATENHPSSSANPSSPERDAFDRDIKQNNLLGYWMIPSRSNGYREPKAGYGAMMWD